MKPLPPIVGYLLAYGPLLILAILAWSLLYFLTH